jgi:GDPmannose 4,6-dehydratase
MKKALIIGSEGQDGTLLQLLLQSKDYQVYGLGRQKQTRLDGLAGYLGIDLFNDDLEPLQDFITEEKPDEIYYVAAFHQSSQQATDQDFHFIDKSVKVNQLGFIRLMEICRLRHPAAKIVYTSSSLIFSGDGQTTQTETTPTSPRCIYSVTKCAAMEAAKYYRASHGLFVSVGIMYNHESSLRTDKFLSQIIINETRKILAGEIISIKIGDFSATTDWGYAPDYVNALWHMLQLPQPDVFIVSSGRPHQVKNWFEVLFGHLGMEWEKYVTEDPSLLIRKKPVLIGDNTKLVSTGWKPEVDFEEMVLRMYKNVI